MRKPIFGVSNTVRHIATEDGLKLENLHYESRRILLSMKRKQMHWSAVWLTCAFVFAYARSIFSHDTAHMFQVVIFSSPCSRVWKNILQHSQYVFSTFYCSYVCRSSFSPVHVPGSGRISASIRSKFLVLFTDLFIIILSFKTDLTGQIV